MVTTIQISDKTLLLLKKLKEEMEAVSYDDVISRVAVRAEKRQYAGSLKKYAKGSSLKRLLRELQGERRRDE